MKIQVSNLLKHKVFNVGISGSWGKDKFVSIALGFISIYLYKEEKKNEQN
jgi:hypothetical protein